jgi:hypothetical protein
MGIQKTSMSSLSQQEAPGSVRHTVAKARVKASHHEVDSC